MATWTRRRAALGAAISSVVATASLLASTATYAGHIPGHIDPGGTGTVPGFNGDAVFTIPDLADCVGQPDGFYDTSSGACAGSTVYSADINLYSTSPSDPPDPGTILGTFNLLGPPDFNPHDFWPVTGVLIVAGAVAGVDTPWMGPNQGTGDWSSHQFWLQFTAFEPDPAQIAMDSLEFPGDFFHASYSNLGVVTFGPPCPDPDKCVVGQTPEPGTLGLLLGAVAGGWFVRRRRGHAKS